VKILRMRSGAGVGAGILFLLASTTFLSASVAAADPVHAGGATALRVHTLPPYATPPDTISSHAAVGGRAIQTESVTDTPGNVYNEELPPTLVSSPTSDPADVISASATDDGTNFTFTAMTVALNDPSTDPNWRNDTYIGWAIEPTTSAFPTYFAYFQVNPDGSNNGELTFAATDTAVSCTVSLTFNTTVGYQAVVPTTCLPGVTSFEWYAYSKYDTVPLAQDPDGNFAFGKAIPDYRRNGGQVFAPPVVAPTAPTTSPTAVTNGYWLFARDGGVFTFGGANFYGSEGGTHLNKPIVGGASTPDGLGYWMVASDGGIFSFGDARFYGSTGALHLNAPIVAMIELPTGTGYWLVASDGGVFAFGGARFYGSTGAMHLNQPIVGGASTPDGLGYWLVASDGGIFAFGDATFSGSEGAVHLNQPVVGMASDPNGGYWLVAADGGVFTFGGAPFLGSTGALSLVKPIEGIAATADGNGYRMVASDGGIFDFGDAAFFGSEGGQPLNQPIVGMTSVG
jgi:hypothetical protein